MKKETLYKLLRVVISIGLIVLMLRMANLSELLPVLKAANFWWFVVAVFLELLRVLISSYRWQVLLSARGIRNSLGSLLSFYFVGNFFNVFLPTVLGGDVMRAYKSAKYSERATDSIASVLVERILDVVCLFVVCWLSLVVFGLESIKGTSILLIVSCLSAALLILLVLLFNRRLMSLLMKLVFNRGLTEKVKLLGKFAERWNLELKLKAFFDSLHEMLRYRKSLGAAFGISLIYQFIGIVTPYLIALALGLNVSFAFFLAVMPVIWVIMMVPISIAGLGVREGAFVFFFTQQGVTTESALLLSLLFFGLSLVLALVGGIIYALGKYPR